MNLYSSILGHHSMIFDDVRNRAYASAIKNAVNADSTVIDLGAGLGIHGLLAAAAGARKVIMIDPSPLVERVREIALENGLASQVEIICKPIEEVQLEEQADLILSVFTGNFLLDEDLLPSLFYARDRFLKPGGTLLPDCAEMKIALAFAPEFYDSHIAGWSKPSQGLDFKSLRKYAANTVYFQSAERLDAELVSSTEKLLSLDFTTAASAACNSQADLVSTRDGICHGLLGWFRMRLGEDWLSTSPEAESLHWSLGFLPFDPPLELVKNETVHAQVDRPEFGEWTWVAETRAGRQQHSTFHSRKIDLAALKKQSEGYQPGLNDKGEALRLLISLMDGGHDRDLMERKLLTRFPGLFPHKASARRFVRNVITRWGK